ncbi:MAG: FAD-dependent oxidoreductase [Thiolinea sp.]
MTPNNSDGVSSDRNASPDDHSKAILVVGAGPTGLATAIFLTEAKQRVRIIEKLSEPTRYSKAMAINPRSLELLEGPGVTPTLLAEGEKIRFIRLGTPKQSLAALDIEKTGHRYGHMIGLPQSETERILEQKLNALGVHVERNTELTKFQQSSESVACELAKEGDTEKVSVDFLVGANGASSNIRKQLGAQFEGHTLPGQWHMADVRLSDTSAFKKSLSSDALHLTFTETGFFFAVSFKPGIHRIASNNANVFDSLPEGTDIEDVEWESMFNINHRLTSCYAKGRVALAGDAAHVHSPIGGRGMNLGIEDAYCLASAITSGNLEQYATSRHKAARTVLRLVNLQTKMALGSNVFFRLLREHIMPIALSIPAIHRVVIRRFLGLNKSLQTL